ncbi:transglutaminase-like cysteine peptidase [Methylobacterium sp. BTF04]|uniref:transglutaminase-like cysteine peptidase n=1 Tax=Methylobacterium sp. BTF04 TaxID=2708300 RepID=UPI001FED4176|nr:transglutaminase-like cysteine peptidase [Methylobacterium sp. BTF04]
MGWMKTGWTKTRALGLLCGLAASTLGIPTGACAQILAALPAASAAAQPVGAARPLAAWTAFCERYAAECAVDLNEPARISLTPALWSTIASVNRQVNRSLRAVTDQDHWGVPDRWDLAEDGAGDCEDYQLLKRKLLAAAGLPRRAMRMTVVIDEKGEGHAVLTLITDRGDFILDNKTSEIQAWYRTGYVFIKREATDAVAWVSLGGVTSPITTANR